MPSIARASLLAASLLLGYLTIRFGRSSDEYDNYLGGCLIAQGKVIYLDFFSNHHPFHYYLLGALYSVFDCQLFLPRLLTLAIIIGTFLLAYRVSGNAYNLLGLFLYVLLAPIYRGQMYLAEVFLGLGLLLLLNATLRPRPDLGERARTIVQVVGHFMVVNSNVSGVFFSGLFLLYAMVRARRWLVPEQAAFLLALVPMPVVMLVQGNATAFFEQAIDLNLNVYSKYIGTSLVNPVDVVMAAYRFVRYRFENILFVVDRWEGRWYQHIVEVVLLGTALAYILWTRRRGYLDPVFLFTLGLLSLNRPIEHRTLPFIAVALFSIAELARSAASRRWQLARAGYITAVLMLTAWTYRLFAPDNPSTYFSLQPPRYESQKDFYLERLTAPDDKVVFYSYDPLAHLTSRRAPGSFHYFFFAWQAEIPGAEERIIREIEANRVRMVGFDTDDRGLMTYGAQIYQHLLSHFKVVDGWDEGDGRMFLRWGDAPRSEGQAAWAYTRRSHTVPSDRPLALSFDAGRLVNAGARHELSAGSRLVAPADGKYLIVGNVTFERLAEGERRVRIVRNGGSVLGERETRAGGSGVTGLSVTAVAALAADDELELEVLQTSGRPLDVRSLPGEQPLDVRRFAAERPSLTLVRIDERATTVEDLIRAAPAATVGVYDDTALTLAPYTDTLLTFSGAAFDGRGSHDPGAEGSRLTVRTPGTYLVTGRISFETGGRDAGGWREAVILANGSRIIGRQTATVTGRSRTDLTVTAVLELAVGEQVELQVAQGSRGPLNVRLGSPERPALTIMRLG